MIQNIAPHRFSNEYCLAPPDRDSYLLCYRGREVLMGRDAKGNLLFPTFGEMELYNDGLYEDYIYLFSLDEKRYYMGKNLNYGPLLIYQMQNLETFRTAGPRHLAFAGITGAQLYRWYTSRRFCGCCGKAMKQDKKERMMYCAECGNREYPKIMPAVIVGITHGNRILLSKYANRDFKKYALIAGFAEIGESIEETVRREVMEEVGLRVKNLRYYKSQPWAFTDTVLMGFFAELEGGEEITLDREELAMAQWFEREEIPVKEQSLSLTNEMILSFKNGLV